MQNQSNLLRLIAEAKAKRIPEAKQPIKEDSFDELDNFIQNSAISSPVQNIQGMNSSNSYEQGDLVSGLHRGIKMAGQVISVEGKTVTVEWKNHDVTSVPIESLERTNIDDDYEIQNMYLESRQAFGFDKEAFCEDTDLDTLLNGSISEGSTYEPSLKYSFNGDF